MDATRENIKSVLLEILSQYPQQSKTEKTFVDAYNEYLKWGEYNLAKKTIAGIKTAFKHFLSFRGNVSLSVIDQRFVDLLAVELMKKAPKGSRVYFRTYRAMFQKFVDWGFISLNPFASLKLPKLQKNETKIFSEDVFISVIENEKCSTLRALYLFCFYCGLRLSEVINLTWENVFISQKYILIGDCSFTTKARKSRKVPLCQKAIDIIEKRIPKIYKAHERNYVFAKSNGFQFSCDWVSKSFKKNIRAVGLSEEYHFHTIRHSTASNLAQMGVPVPIIQQILGHSNLQTTMLYTHTNVNDLINAVTVFDKNSQHETKLGKCYE
jgi:site-specific recombinase XerD